jgi:hypothetical protein
MTLRCGGKKDPMSMKNDGSSAGQGASRPQSMVDKVSAEARIATAGHRGPRSKLGRDAMKEGHGASPDNPAPKPKTPTVGADHAKIEPATANVVPSPEKQGDATPPTATKTGFPNKGLLPVKTPPQDPTDRGNRQKMYGGDGSSGIT